VNKGQKIDIVNVRPLSGLLVVMLWITDLVRGVIENGCRDLRKALTGCCPLGQKLRPVLWADQLALVGEQRFQPLKNCCPRAGIHLESEVKTKSTFCEK
jgi:hypothetical protein